MSKIQSMPKMLAFAGAVCALSVGQFAALADVKYTQETRMPGMSGAAKTNSDEPMTVTTTWIKKGAQRVETRQQTSYFNTHEATLTLCDKRQVIRMDPALQIYSVAELDEKTGMAKPSVPKETIKPTSKRETGKITMTATVKFIGTETVAGLKARHYMITQRHQTSGCAGNNDTTHKSEIWVADYDMPEFNCGFKPGSYSHYAGGGNSCDIAVEQKGDTAALTAAYKGLIVRMKMYNDDKVFMIQETTLISAAKLEDASFSVPAGFKQLSGEEYDKARSDAMMSAMQNRTGANSGASNANASPASATNDEAALDAEAAAAVAAENGGNATNTNQQAQSDGDNAVERAAKEAAKNQITKRKRKFGLPF